MMLGFNFNKKLEDLKHKIFHDQIMWSHVNKVFKDHSSETIFEEIFELLEDFEKDDIKNVFLNRYCVIYQAKPYTVSLSHLRNIYKLSIE